MGGRQLETISFSDTFPSMQFGDFFNGAQVMIDTFISSAESKPSALGLFLSMSLQGTRSEMASSEWHRAAPSPRSGRRGARTLFFPLGAHVTSGDHFATAKLLSLTVILSRSYRMIDTDLIRKNPISICTSHSQQRLRSTSTC